MVAHRRRGYARIVLPPPFDTPPNRSDADDRRYFLRRSEAHRALAEASSDAGHRALHLRFAALYVSAADAGGVVQQD